MSILRGTWSLFQIIGTLAITVAISIILLQLASQQSFFRLPFKAFVVSSGSMEPTIMTGDVVFVRQRKSYGAEDIITYKSPEGHIVTHRIISVASTPLGEIQFQTKGDNNNAKDPYTISGSAIMGAWWFSVPLLGYIEVYARTPVGIIIIISVLFGWIISDLVWQILKKQELAKQQVKRS